MLTRSSKLQDLMRLAPQAGDDLRDAIALLHQTFSPCERLNRRVVLNQSTWEQISKIIATAERLRPDIGELNLCFTKASDLRRFADDVASLRIRDGITITHSVLFDHWRPGDLPVALFDTEVFDEDSIDCALEIFSPEQT